METIFPALKLTWNSYLHCNVNIFLKNWQINHKLVPPSPMHMLYWKAIFTIWQNIKNRGLQKLQFWNTLANQEKCSLDYLKIIIFYLFHELRKTWKYAQLKTNISKSKFWIYGWTGKSSKQKWENHIKKDGHILNIT